MKTPKPRIAKDTPMNIRLETELVNRLDAVAEKLGIPKSTLIRMLTKRFVDHFDASGGSIRIPVEFAAESPHATPIPVSPSLYAAENPPVYPTKPKK